MCQQVPFLNSSRFHARYLTILIFSLIVFWGISLSATASDFEITLAWDHSTQSEVVGYRLYYGKSNASYSDSVDVGYCNQFSLEYPELGQIYHFALTAYDAQGNESDYSNEVVYDRAPSSTGGNDSMPWLKLLLKKKP